MAYSVTPLAGIDLTNIEAGALVGNQPKFGPLLAQCFASDGSIYMYAKATTVIGANTATVAIANTGLASATGGVWLSPATAMAIGDYAWFKGAFDDGTPA